MFARSGRVHSLASLIRSNIAVFDVSRAERIKKLDVNGAKFSFTVIRFFSISDRI
jgi:predicted ester cyclase